MHQHIPPIKCESTRTRSVQNEAAAARTLCCDVSDVSEDGQEPSECGRLPGSALAAVRIQSVKQQLVDGVDVSRAFQLVIRLV